MRNITLKSVVDSILSSSLSICLLGFAFALTGCSSVKMRSDGGPVRGESFSFLKPGPAAPLSVEDRSEVHAVFQEAITRNLAAKGVHRVDQGGDLTVAYLIIVGNNGMTTSLGRYFGYSPDAEELVNKVHTEQTEKAENRNYFEAGTLVIDIIDAKTSKVLQRRSVQAQVLRNLPTQTRIERAQKVVDLALADVKISR